MTKINDALETARFRITEKCVNTAARTNGKYCAHVRNINVFDMFDVYRVSVGGIPPEEIPSNYRKSCLHTTTDIGGPDGGVGGSWGWRNTIKNKLGGLSVLKRFR